MSSSDLTEDIDPEALALSRCLKALDSFAPSLVRAQVWTDPRISLDRTAVHRILDHLAARYGITPTKESA